MHDLLGQIGNWKRNAKRLIQIQYINLYSLKMVLIWDVNYHSLSSNTIIFLQPNMTKNVQLFRIDKNIVFFQREHRKPCVWNVLHLILNTANFHWALICFCISKMFQIKATQNLAYFWWSVFYGEDFQWLVWTRKPEKWQFFSCGSARNMFLKEFIIYMIPLQSWHKIGWYWNILRGIFSPQLFYSYTVQAEKNWYKIKSSKISPIMYSSFIATKILRFGKPLTSLLPYSK